MPDEPAAARKPLTEMPAWRAPCRALRADRRCPTFAPCSPMIRGGARRLALEAAGVYLDFSKNRLTEETLALLCALADSCGLKARIDAMFSGQRINRTESRPVLHVALRAPRGSAIHVDGKDVVPGVHAGPRQDVRVCRARCAPANGRGHTGRPIRNLVNIGIGGSDLGPKMACAALRPFGCCAGSILGFVSNIDGADFHEARRGARPGRKPCSSSARRASRLWRR